MKGTTVEVPVWKKDLVARLRNKCAGNQALTVREKQPSPLYPTDPGRQTSAGIPSKKSDQSPRLRDDSSKFASPLTLRKAKMVQERAWSGEYNSWGSDNSRASDSDSSEELHYGPGIVSKLKNKYLSLALEHQDRHKNLRKAASLEDILDGDDVHEDVEPLRHFRTNDSHSNRYRHPKRGVKDMKRARSMETISRFENLISPPPENGRPKSMHECLLIADLQEGNDDRRKPDIKMDVSYAPRINRPKRIAPMMNEREKPPADVVKQAKMIFEKRPEQRTKPPASTGDVAAKIASYRSIIVQTKQAKKPPVKTKPNLSFAPKPVEDVKPKTCPKAEPPKVTPRFKTTTKKTPDENPPKTVEKPPKTVEKTQKAVENPPKTVEKPPQLSVPDLVDADASGRLCHTPDLIMTISPVAESTPSNGLPQKPQEPPSPLEVIKKASSEVAPREKLVSPPIGRQKDLVVLEKNLINAAKSSEKVEEDKGKKVRRPPRQPDTNSVVFKFTDRKDVPDYVQNDRSKKVGRLERPKVGEGGIILLPGAAIDESFTDEDEEIRKYLEAPPSPCDVTFINDNILIDGKSSIKQKTKRSPLKISFVESGPDVFEYPSESSLLTDESPTSIPSSPPMTGHTVPNLAGSYLANYIPKSTEEFQPGVTRSMHPTPQTKQEQMEEEEKLLLEEVEQPVTFSAGTNSDMLF